MNAPVPRWLRERRMEHARAAKIRRCRRCGAPVLVGLDSDICAITVEIDLTPISKLGEAISLMQGRPTYELFAGKGRREIWYRDEWRIATRRRPVFPAHRCHAPMTDHLDPAYSRPAPTVSNTASADRSPF